MSHRPALLIAALALLACPGPAPPPATAPPGARSLPPLSSSPGPRPAAAPPSRAPAAAPLSNGLSRAEIARVVRAHEHVLLDCYRSVLTVRPKLSVFARVTAQVQSDGSLRNVRIEDPRGLPVSPEFATCAGPEIRSWRFPRPRGGGTVVFKHVFVYRPGPGAW